jgi:hypothetical protein
MGVCGWGVSRSPRHTYPWKMRLVSLLLAVCTAFVFLPARVGAHQLAPPGNSGVNQYLEDVPAAGGNQPVPPVSAGSVASGSHTGGGGSPVQRSLSQLAHLGNRGSRAAGVAAAGIPRAVKAPAGQPGSGAAAALVHAAGGSGFGMGVALALILVGAAAAAAGAFVVRRRQV